MNNCPKQLLWIFLLGLPWWLHAQKNTVSGNVKDAANGEDLIGATITVRELPGTGITSNAYGFYALSLPPGQYTLRFNYLGYTPLEKPVDLTKSDQTLHIHMQASAAQLAEVEIKAIRDDRNISNNEMGVARLSPAEIRSVPVIFGEPDILKTLQLMPGVQSAGEGNTGFFVRGGASDQNLILLDEAPVYNASHLLGFFSVFNSDAIKDVTLYKGNMPAEYGGRASSVLDVRMKEGNNQKFGVSGGIGLIASKLTVEGPIVKDKGSFVVSGRRTYADMFLKLSKEESVRKSSLYFYDLNMKSNYRLGERDRIFLSGYFGRDNFGMRDLFGFDWGNATATLRWNHLFSEKLFSNTSAIFSNYNYKIRLETDSSSSLAINSGIRDLNFKQDFGWFLSESHTVKFGANAIYHRFAPGEIKTGEGSSFNSMVLEDRYALESSAYLQDSWTISPRLSAEIGIRYSRFNYLGPGTAYDFDQDGNVTGEEEYGEWENIKTYGGWEPRLSLRYQLNDVSAVKASLNRNYQYMHLLSNSTTGTPTDLWMPSTNNIDPQISDQVAVGYFRNFADNTLEFSMEAYYKRMNNLIDYRNGADLFFNKTIESELVYGKGEAYGMELLLRKTRGRLTGWVSYTLSRTLREFDAVNDGDPYPARQDRIHDLSIVGMYDISRRWKFSATWVFNTGDAATFPSGSYEFEGRRIPYYTERNGYRFPNYHRLDLGATFIARKTSRYESSWNFSVYNAYGRQNTYAISFAANEDDPQKNEATQIALFRWIPSATWNFKF
ncbi:MAG: TonB-dependent receptor [Saprospiraceae bacterium]|nr:TonB-dependent receptor [Lewinellaceae bacterium]